MVKQGQGATGYFSTLCFKKIPSQTKLEIIGVHAGGGMGKAFFLVPKISIFNNRWELVEQNLSRVKQNPFTGNLEAEVDLNQIPSGEYVLLIEGDNRSGARGIGSYIQSTYALGPIITSVDMYALPNGKARLTLKTSGADRREKR